MARVYSVSSGRRGLVPGQRYLANSIALKLPSGGAALRYQVLHWVRYGARTRASHISARLGGGSGSVAFCPLIHRLVPPKEICHTANRHVHHSIKPRETVKERIVAWTCLQCSVKKINLERENSAPGAELIRHEEARSSLGCQQTCLLKQQSISMALCSFQIL